jgi:2'-5' RNA ligase
VIAVVSYPVLTEADRLWIEAIRARHDPQAARLPAHFTLVFPSAGTNDLVREVAFVAATSAPIAFRLDAVRAVRDLVAGAGAHVMLVAARGGAQIAALHDRLYRGVLRAGRRVDVPFVPHVTVGASADYDRCAAVAAAVGTEQRPIEGRLERLDIVDLDGPAVTTIRSLALTGSATVS